MKTLKPLSTWPLFFLITLLISLVVLSACTLASHDQEETSNQEHCEPQNDLWYEADKEFFVSILGANEDMADRAVRILRYNQIEGIASHSGIVETQISNSYTYSFVDFVCVDGRECRIEYAHNSSANIELGRFPSYIAGLMTPPEEEGGQYTYFCMGSYSQRISDEDREYYGFYRK
jgi:hypothetical protein